MDAINQWTNQSVTCKPLSKLIFSLFINMISWTATFKQNLMNISLNFNIMIRKVFFTLMVVTIFSSKSEAQNLTGRISGVIKDVGNKPLSGATLILKSERDTVKKQTMMAGDNGAFAFKNLSIDNYQITCSHTGFKDFELNHLVIDAVHPAIILPVIVLQSSGNHTLKDVVIISKKPLIEQKIDRTIVNVDAMISAAGSSALDVLGKTPGVYVDPNGGILLNGQGGVLVLIDDRSTYLSAQDLSAYLRSLPASLIDKIELMSNPPARYDASGSAIINLQLKKNRASGFNGNLSLSYAQGVYGRSNDAMNINYRTKKMNLFGNLSYSRNASYSSDKSSRFLYDANGGLNSTILLNSRYNYSSDSWNARTGLDYFVSPNTTIGFILNGNLRPKTDLLNYSSSQYNAGMQLDSLSIGSTNGDYDWKSSGANVNMQHKFKSNSATISADLDYIRYISDGRQLSPYSDFSAFGSLTANNTILSKLQSDINIYAIKTDYTLPLKGNMQVDAGAKSSFVNTDDANNRFNQVGTAFIPDFSNTNRFIYNENINAAYISAKKEWSRWGIQAGLRMENTQAKGHQPGNSAVPDSSFSKNYTKLFPSLFLSYKLDKAGNNTLVFSYSVRVKRPSYQQLDPFVNYVNQYTYGSGNPSLTPQYNHITQLKYSYKQYFGVIIAYYHVTPIMYGITQQVGNIFISRPENFGTNNSINFTAFANVSPLKGWDLNANMLVFNLTNKGNAFGEIIDANHTTGEIELSNQFQLGHGWSGEVNYVYHGPGYGGQSITNPSWNSSAGIQKRIWNSKGTLRLKADDIFHTQRPHYTSTLEHASYTHVIESDTRVIGLSFSYRFGKDANARKRNNTGSAEDEKGRTN